MKRALPVDRRQGPGEEKLAAAVGLFAFVVGARALLGGFVYDDAQNVLQNGWIQDPARLGEAFTHQMAAFLPGMKTSFYRPELHVVLAACHALFGLRPWGYHLAVLLLHALTSGGVYLLLARWTEERGTAGSWRGAVVSAPVLGALAFAAHPVHVETFAWISGVVDLSFALFLLFALVAATDERRPPWLRLSAAPALFFVALLSKEPAIALLPIWAVAALSRGALSDPARRRSALALTASLCAAAALYLALRVNALGSLSGGGGSYRVVVSWSEGVLTAIALYGEYLRLLVLPVGLTAMHDVRVVHGPLEPAFLLGAVALLATAVLCWRGRRSPAVALGLALLVLPLLPALFPPVLGEGLLAERYLYAPSIGAALLLSALLACAPRWARAVALVGISALASSTLVRTGVWADDRSLWADAATKSPESAAAHEYYGHALLAAGELEPAVRALGRALELDPKRTHARVNLASTLAALGRYPEAGAHVELVLRERPRLAEAWVVLGNALAGQGLLEGALVAYERALALAPKLAGTHWIAGRIHAELGRRPLALQHLREAVRLEPANLEFVHSLQVVSGER